MGVQAKENKSRSGEKGEKGRFWQIIAQCQKMGGSDRLYLPKASNRSTFDFKTIFAISPGLNFPRCRASRR